MTVISILNRTSLVRIHAIRNRSNAFCNSITSITQRNHLNYMNFCRINYHLGNNQRCFSTLSGHPTTGMTGGLLSICNQHQPHYTNSIRDQSTNKSSREKLQMTIKQYGPVAFATHIVISLISLGTFYLLISSGVDVVALFNKLGLDTSNAVAGASTFMVAYVVHKLIMPVRVGITVATVPLVVRHLRKIGLFKKK